MHKAKPWLLLLLLAIAVLGAAWGIHAYRYRRVGSDRDLIALLPHTPANTLFFANVGALRMAGMLDVLTGSGDQEYQAFISDSGFDFSRDLDSIAGASDGRQTYFLARGRFERDRMERYVRRHSGTCQRDVCRVPTSKPDRWASFLFLQPDVLGLAISPDQSAASRLESGSAQSPPTPIPSDPVWLQVSPQLLKDPSSLPLALRIFAISLQPATSVLLALNRSNQSEAALDLQLRATCPKPVTARSVKKQLEIQTEMLRLELAREHRQPNPADLTGLLTGGTFRDVQNEVVGNWAISKVFLATLR